MDLLSETKKCSPTIRWKSRPEMEHFRPINTEGLGERGRNYTLISGSSPVSAVTVYKLAQLGGI
jgi:hypothetical protein